MTTAAIILAGGRGSRLEGACKPLLRHGSGTLLDAAIAAARTVADPHVIVVVGPDDLGVPADVATVRESPPFSGPVAAINVGVATVQQRNHGEIPDRVWILAADQPTVRESVGVICREVQEETDDVDEDFPYDGAIGIDASGRHQYLTGWYRGPVLAANLILATVDGQRKVRRVLGDMSVLEVELGDRLDVDTPDDAAHFGIVLPEQ